MSEAEALECLQCEQPISGPWFRVNGYVTCELCAARRRAKQLEPGDKLMDRVMGLIYGGLVSVVCAVVLIWVRNGTWASEEQQHRMGARVIFLGQISIALAVFFGSRRRGKLYGLCVSFLCWGFSVGLARYLYTVESLTREYGAEASQATIRLEALAFALGNVLRTGYATSFVLLLLFFLPWRKAGEDELKIEGPFESSKAKDASL